MSETTPVTKVARNLTWIVDLYADLMAQAIHHAGDKIDGHSLPGGEAMVALARVADPEIHGLRVTLHEERHMATCLRLDHTRCWTGSEDEDDAEPVLQTLLFWSEQWRTEHGFPLEGRRPTVATEANVIRSLLEWAWENLPEWDDFENDIRAARRKLEALLHAGEQRDTGAPCMDCRVPLHREWGRLAAADGWRCPRCKAWRSDEDYRRNVAEVHQSRAEWLTAAEVETLTGIKPATLRKRVERGELSSRRDSGRVVYEAARISEVVAWREAIA